MSSSPRVENSFVAHELTAAPAEKEAPQETDVWWGSFSGWAMLPSLFVCIVLTGAIVAGVGAVVERRYVQWTIWGLAGAVWLVQSFRWSHRVFGTSYRLTTHRLLIDHGHWWPCNLAIRLDEIQEVTTVSNALTPWTKIGRVVIRTARETKIMEGVRHPEEVAQRIRSVSPRGL
jgi:membrane protein YdbS with pleckstrin-like domain